MNFPLEWIFGDDVFSSRSHQHETCYSVPGFFFFVSKKKINFLSEIQAQHILQTSMTAVVFGFSAAPVEL